jgi:hypothetical protein
VPSITATASGVRAPCASIHAVIVDSLTSCDVAIHVSRICARSAGSSRSTLAIGRDTSIASAVSTRANPAVRRSTVSRAIARG